MPHASFDRDRTLMRVYTSASYERIRKPLGAAVPREIGGQIYDYPVVAGALISKASSRDYYDGPPYDPYSYGPYPYGGYGWHPWHYPFYGPHFGTGIFFHID